MGARGEDQGHETVDARGLRTAKGGVRADHYQSRINQGGAQADDQERGLILECVLGAQAPAHSPT